MSIFAPVSLLIDAFSHPQMGIQSPDLCGMNLRMYGSETPTLTVRGLPRFINLTKQNL